VFEWPDSDFHIARVLKHESIYPLNLFNFLAELTHPIRQGDFAYFADKLVYYPDINHFLANLERLPFVLTMTLALYMLSQWYKKGLLVFCPPLIFSLCSPSQEAIALCLLLAAVAISNRHWIAAVLLALLSTTLDRSMVPSASFFILFISVPFFRVVATSPRWLLAMVMIFAGVTYQWSPQEFSSAFYIEILQIFGLDLDDLTRSQKLGAHSHQALIASAMGLYGSMSIRPLPFWLYYSVIGVLFIIGFLVSQTTERCVFSIFQSLNESERRFLNLSH
jgi:hypothetical protein